MNMTGLAVVLAYGLLGAALLVVLWPTEHSGWRFLRRWGVTEPTGPQGLAAARYLRQRRLLYPVLFLLAPIAMDAVFSATGPPRSDAGAFRLLVPFLAGLLLAEVIAALRPMRGVRVATLVRRGWRDLVPTWAMVTLFALAALATLLAAAGLLAQPWADRFGAALPPNGAPQPPTDWRVEVSEQARAEIANSSSWVALAGVVVCLVAVLGLVRLAVRRRAVGDPVVDAVLRTRTARVAVGIGFGWLASMANIAAQRIGFLASLSPWSIPDAPPTPGWLRPAADVTQFLGLLLIFVTAAAWIWVANPAPRRAEARVVE